MYVPHVILYPFICWWIFKLASISWLLWIMLLEALWCVYIFKLVLSFPSDIHPGMELLDHTVILLTVKKNFFKKKYIFFHKWVIVLYNCTVETFLKHKNQGPEVIIETMDKFVYVIYLYIFYKQSQMTINKCVKNICTNTCVIIVSALLHITIEHLENTAIKRD